MYVNVNGCRGNGAKNIVVLITLFCKFLSNLLFFNFAVFGDFNSHCSGHLYIRYWVNRYLINNFHAQFLTPIDIFS